MSLYVGETVWCAGLGGINTYKKRSVRQVAYLQELNRKEISVLWNVMPCSFVDWYGRFGETCCLHLQITAKLKTEPASTSKR